VTQRVALVADGCTNGQFGAGVDVATVPQRASSFRCSQRLGWRTPAGMGIVNPNAVARVT
jgi:hypothetical protein